MYIFDDNAYFRRDEFECPCCGRCDMQWNFMHQLTTARGLSGVSYIINSGYRCKNYNMQINGAGDSAHTYGAAADIRAVSDKMRWKIVHGLIVAHFNRIWVYKRHIHADIHPNKEPGRLGLGEYK